MKLIAEINEENRDDSVFRVSVDGADTVFRSHSVDFPFCRGTLVLEEGVEGVERYSLSGTYFHTIVLPKSLETLGERLFSAFSYYSVKTVLRYAGTSEEFQRIAAVREEEVLESDGFDRYPYYSGNSCWVTYYRAFDNDASDLEVVCADGVTLLYGARHRKDAEPPKVKA